ncbi:opioid growth factor receptor-like [Leptodactylus fuscus]|uniref:opioid growth factor receptor-like n=1 Tax=Leptodactylus fuscus TaxID=238119 RepID=UPI003F4EB3F6
MSVSSLLPAVGHSQTTYNPPLSYIRFHTRFPRSIPSGDLQMYRHRYPPNDKTLSLTPNLDFYKNREPFQPNGVYIEEILFNWKYDILEMNHSYIQWLFPLQKPGRNSRAKPLTMYEIQIMKQDQEVRRRFLAAYRLMLGFYGIVLQDCETGMVTRAKNWKERFHNLNIHSHNNLRITRILKCLGEMGFEHFQAPLVQFFLEETLRNNNLPNVERSVLDYFMFTIKNTREHRALMQWIQFISVNKRKKNLAVEAPVVPIVTAYTINRS